MSYTIIYNRQFIKVDDNHVIPFLEMGCNNVTERYCGRERRARDWGNTYAFSKGMEMIVANNAIIESIGEFEEPHRERSDYDPKMFGYFSGVSLYGKTMYTTSFSAYRSYHVNAIKEAKTIEELLENDIKISIYIPWFSHDDIKKKGLDVKPDVTFQSTQHLIETVAEFENYYKDKCIFYLKTNRGWAIEQMKKRQNRDKRKQRKEKTLVEVNEFYVLANEGGYFVRNIVNGYKYSFFIGSRVKTFMTLKEAQKFHSKMKYRDLFRIEKKESPRKFYV